MKSTIAPTSRITAGPSTAVSAAEPAIELALLLRGRFVEHARQFAGALAARDQAQRDRRKQSAFAERARKRAAFAHLERGAAHRLAHRQVRHDLRRDAERIEQRHRAFGEQRERARRARSVRGARETADQRHAQQQRVPAVAHRFAAQRDPCADDRDDEQRSARSQPHARMNADSAISARVASGSV